MANVNANVKDRLDNSPMAHNFSEKVQNLSNVAEKATHDIGSRLGSAVSTVTEQTAQYTESTRQYVKSHPIQSVLIAAGVGLVLGSLVSMGSRR